MTTIQLFAGFNASPQSTLFYSLFVAIGLISFLVLRRRRGIWGSVESNLPANAPAPDWIARLVEAAVLAIASFGLLALCVTNSNTGGYFGDLEGMPDSFIHGYLGWFTVAVIALGFSVMACLLSRTRLGVIVAAGTLSIYGFYLNSIATRDRFEWSQQQREAQDEDAYMEIHLVRNRAFENASEYEGAEIWNGDKMLGHSPLKIGMKEWYARGPFKTEQPIPIRDQEERKFYPSPTRVDPKRISPWIPVVALRQDLKAEGSRPIFYVHARLGDEWGLGLGGYGGSGSDQVSYTKTEVDFPKADARLRQMLALAPLNDYQISDEWWNALASYGDAGQELLDEAAATDPQLALIVEIHENETDGLTSPSTADEAWTRFERILTEADNLDQYDTASEAGKKVELLASLLDPVKLAKLAEKTIQQCGRVIAGWEDRDGRIDFAYAPSTEFAGGFRHKTNYSSMILFGQGRLAPPSAYAIAHAVWLVDQLLDASGEQAPNLIERGITGELLRRYDQEDKFLRLACVLGGPELDTFLLRHNWRGSWQFGQEEYRENAYDLGFTHTNKWLYLLANLQDEAGRVFRKENKDLILAMAEKLAVESRGPDVLGFIFTDRDLGDDSLAMRFWRQNAVLIPDFQAQKDLLEYLARMGPYLNPEHVAEALHIAMRDKNWQPYEVTEGWDALEAMPRDTRVACYKRAIEELETLKRDERFSEDSSPQTLERQQLSLLGYLIELADPSSMESWINELAADTKGTKREATAGWLRETAPYSALADLLATRGNPDLRLMAIDAFEGWPTQERRVLLVQLAGEDADGRVRSAAAAALGGIEEIKAIDPSQLAISIPIQEAAR